MRQPTAVVQLGDAHINVLVAADDAARTKGLGGRNTLGAQQGMLFDFGTGGRWNVWMKDMRFAIDIVWLNSDKQVVWVEPMVSPATYPQPFKPFGDARYVLELGSGEAAKNNIDIGDYATFSLSPAIK